MLKLKMLVVSEVIVNTHFKICIAIQKMDLIPRTRKISILFGIFQSKEDRKSYFENKFLHILAAMQ